MALPFILSLLGSTAAGAGMLGTMSPLIAGALGSGVGSAIESGSLEEGLRTGLTAGLFGGIGGMLTGGAGAAATGAGAGAGAGAAAATGAAEQAAQQGILGNMFQNMPSGFQPGSIPGIDAATLAGRVGQIGSGAGQVPLGQVLQGGFQQGAMTGAGLGTALGGAMMSHPPGMDVPGQGNYERPGIDPNTRRQSYTPPENYQPGRQGEFLYFDPWVPNVQGYAEGGQVQVSRGGIAEMAPQLQSGQAQRPQMNDKQLVQAAIQAVSGAMPEAEAAAVLGQFLQTFGEDALRQLVDDVQSGRAAGPRGDVEGTVQGPGDGMDDMVPAAMDDGSQDVLLSDGEFVVPADVVSGIGNGSTDAGADELYKMMERVRQERTGMREQPKQVAAGGLMPA